MLRSSVWESSGHTLQLIERIVKERPTGHRDHPRPRPRFINESETVRSGPRGPDLMKPSSGASRRERACS
jgi:hypothetical protein